MSAINKAFENAKGNLIPALKDCTAGEKVDYYNTWAKTYEEDVLALEYRAPCLAANIISSHFSGDREAAVVLDVACGTGLVAKQLKTHGFRKFVGVDASKAMLALARETGLYQELKQCMLGDYPLPVQLDSADVIVIVGALSAFTKVPVSVVREMCKAGKPGGYICMTTRDGPANQEFKAALERELKKMEEEGLITCAEINQVKEFELGVLEEESGYISGSVYLYKKV
ncbi:methyltransferase-like protein 27 isoform X1 [Brachionichthys hirsutus]|uniref:methyltransferase-like protein 27 isoform X1 n=1 Tax=Brachionichthys hirsutus TaxID=412623 RepID=UPI0036045720